MRAVLALVALALAAPLAAQTAPAPQDDRLDRIERQLRALQRQVFPDGSAAGDTASAASPPAAPGGAERLDAMQRQLDALNTRISQLAARVDTLAARPAESEAAQAPARPVKRRASDPPPQQVDETEAPPGEEAAYTKAYRLYAAKRFGEAQAALKAFTERYPSGRRASYARNLLGRAYLDGGKPALASVTLLDNYQRDPKGARAADSLSWLGTALIRLGKRSDACRVFREFGEVYGGEAPADARARVAQGRAAAKCGR